MTTDTAQPIRSELRATMARLIYLTGRAVEAEDFERAFALVVRLHALRERYRYEHAVEGDE